jgi:histidinol dehydrogenase
MSGSPELEAYLAGVVHETGEYETQVQTVGEEIRKRGDEAVFEFTARFDRAKISADNFRVSSLEMVEAYSRVDDEYIVALRSAIANVERFHRKQLRPSWMEPDEDGSVLGLVRRPLERVGIYVPGGTAAYPSSVLMNAIPAQVAGVSEIVMVSPPAADGSMNPYTLVAAAELGLNEIYKVGGAQAIFAMAWGTESIKAVDKVTGPGNIYVTLAKKMVYGDVDIDMLAGPSEILVIADGSTPPAWVAADLMSQAEHDVLARSVLVSDDAGLLDSVEKEILLQVENLSRKDIILQSLSQKGAFILVDNLAEACQVANRVAPEHLEIMTEQAFELLGQIKNAGAVFLGRYTPEPVGDYYAGPNHILPTGGTARFYSPVTVDTFMKQMSVISYSRAGFAKSREAIAHLADVEGLTAHANSIRIRKGE